MKVKALILSALVVGSTSALAASLPDAATFNKLLSDEASNSSSIPGGDLLASAAATGDTMDDGSSNTNQDSSANSSATSGNDGNNGNTDSGTGDDDY